MEILTRLRFSSDQIDRVERKIDIDWLVPIVADAEAGFGGALNVFELIKAMIEGGVAGVHLEDQLASEKKCGHMGGKVLIPTRHAVRNLIAARLAADVSNVPTLIIARTDANAAKLLTSDVDERDHEFLTGERTPEGFFCVQPGLDQAISRACSYAPYADLVWCETKTPDLDEARKFAEAVHENDRALVGAVRAHVALEHVARQLLPGEVRHCRPFGECVVVSPGCAGCRPASTPSGVPGGAAFRWCCAVVRPYGRTFGGT